jgi:hypothetical protein
MSSFPKLIPVLLLFFVYSGRSLKAESESLEECSESWRQAAAIAPFVDDQTLLVIAMAWPETQLAECIETVSAMRPGIIETSGIRPILASLTRAGVREAYLIGSLAYLPEHTPLLVVPITGDTDVDKAIKALKDECEAAIVCRGSVIAGDTVTVVGAKNTEAFARPEIADAVEALENATFKILFLPTNDQVSILEAMLPRLPAEIGAPSIKTLTRGCRWAALGFHASPKRLQLVVKSADEQSAGVLRDLWERLARMACLHPDVIEAMPSLDDPVRVLTPTQRDNRLLLSLCAEKQEINAMSALLRAPAAMARDSADRSQSRQHMLAIGLALQTYADKHHAFPPATMCSSWGLPLLSWRVQILPFLGERELYERFHLNEPWNSKHNRQLIELMPAVFRHPGRQAQNGRTPYVTPRGRGTALNARDETPYDAFRDTTTNTILVVEANADHEVLWTQPTDLEFNPEEPFHGLNDTRKPGFLALFADGGVRLISRDIDPNKLRALFTRAGGEDVDPGD